MLLGMGHPYYQAVSGIKEDVAVLLLGGNPALQGGGGGSRKLEAWGFRAGI
jgi:hypothetical protein